MKHGGWCRREKHLTRRGTYRLAFHALVELLFLSNARPRCTNKCFRSIGFLFLCHARPRTLMAPSNKHVCFGRLKGRPRPCGTSSKPALAVYTNPTFMLITFMMIKRPSRWEGEGEQLCPPLQTHTHTHTRTHTHSGSPFLYADHSFHN